MSDILRQKIIFFPILGGGAPSAPPPWIRPCYAYHKCSSRCPHEKKNVLKIVLIIVNINKDENKSLISNQFSLKNDLRPCIG
jgi:hypothetical protein